MEPTVRECLLLTICVPLVDLHMNGQKGEGNKSPGPFLRSLSVCLALKICRGTCHAKNPG